MPKKLQKWFNKNYSQDGKKEIGDITISDKKWKTSDGPLEIKDFKLLKTINLKNFQLTNLRVIDCPELTEFSLLKFTSNLIISNCSKLHKINFSGCSIETLFVGDCLELTELNCSQSQLKSLDLSNHNLLKKLDCSKNKLTELSVSNLTELDCSNNLIEYLNLNLCPEITKLNCSNNRLAHLEISNCSNLDDLNFSNNKLEELDISNCPKLKSRPELEELAKKIKLKLVKEKNPTVRNILIVGRTGGGKSTLSNVLSNTDKFSESERSISKTKNFQNKTFEHNGISYRVIDTIGVGDTNLAKKKVLYKIAEGIYSMPEGISHVLFVVDGRFTAEEIETFFTFKKAIFESGITDYITIVRTKFSSFKNYWECALDKQDLRNESDKISEIVKSCNDIRYADNPPISFAASDDDDNEMIKVNGKIRNTSRSMLLNYLETKCQKECHEKCHLDKCQKELKEHRIICTKEHQKKWQEEFDRIRKVFLGYSEENQEKLLNILQGKSKGRSQEKLMEELKRICQKEHQESCEAKEHKEKCEFNIKRKEYQLEEHQKKCQLEDHQKCQLEGDQIFCKKKCYYKLKEWDDLRDEIAIYMKEINLDSENLEKIEDIIAEIMERRLQKELPAFIRTFNKVKEGCSII